MSPQEAQQFLTQEKITHIVLENGDQPSPFLQSITKEIYANATVKVLCYKEHR
jgi:hypothetical protein